MSPADRGQPQGDPSRSPDDKIGSMTTQLAFPEHKQVDSDGALRNNLNVLDVWLEMMAELQHINGLGPASFPEYPLEVYLHREITSSDFTSRMFAFSNIINGLISGLSDHHTFLPATIVVSAPGGWDEDGHLRDRLRAIMDISTPQRAWIVQIGTWNENEEEWVHSEIYVDGKAVSKTKEGEIRKKFAWFDGQR